MSDEGEVIALSDLVGREVVAVATAENIGEVKAVVLDRAATRVERIQVGGRKRSPELVDWSRVERVGADAVMVASADAVHESRQDEPDDLYVRGDIAIVGARVLDVSGRLRGVVTDVHIAERSGEIRAFMTDQGRVPADAVRSLGTFALVISS